MSTLTGRVAQTTVGPLFHSLTGPFWATLGSYQPSRPDGLDEAGSIAVGSMHFERLHASAADWALVPFCCKVIMLYGVPLACCVA